MTAIAGPLPRGEGDPRAHRRAARLTVEEAAAGIRRVADNQMPDLLRKVTIEQGHDPRDFVVYAYGGAGPTHAYAYTEAAGISALVVPPTSTVHSAYRAITSARYRAVQTTEVLRTPPGADDPAAAFLGERAVHFPEISRVPARVYCGEGLGAGAALHGPATLSPGPRW
ncbi:hydantoinase/oxoprolinase family protein [Actinomadura sp. 9N215]|uniref:hydantoinase/oxoprolinase family protein n=1 Tax=Actinomadura sp. 9N215 TaxID=3375150 RepID=UPI00378CCF54